MENILTFAKENCDSFKVISTSSNEVRKFEFDGKEYVLKTPLMVGDNLSPFWLMMKSIFDFSFEGQNVNFEMTYNLLKTNPHISVVPFIAGDAKAMIFEHVQGDIVDGDDFPEGENNAYKLGQYVGYNHQKKYAYCGLVGKNNISDFFPKALAHMENVISDYWDGDEKADKIVRGCYARIRDNEYKSAGYSPIMVDICADQFMYKNSDVISCIDLDAYVIGPVEWELSFLHTQIKDWESFCKGYENYQPMPEFSGMSEFFFLLMALNSYHNKSEICQYWSRYLQKTI